MNIDRVKYKDGRAYVEYIYKSGRRKGQARKDYGQIIICQACNKKAFASDRNIKVGDGECCSKKCARYDKKGKLHPRWKGGRKKIAGYIFQKRPKHPNAINGYVREHRLVVEQQIGRYLHRWEVCHHINKIKDDNRPEKLMAFNGHAAHNRFERGCSINPKDIIFDGRKLCKTEGVKNGKQVQAY